MDLRQAAGKIVTAVFNEQNLAFDKRGEHYPQCIEAVLVHLRKVVAVKLMLTERDMAVLNLLKEGFTAKQIGPRFNISPRTAEYHITRLKEKLGAKNTAQLIAKSASMHLIEFEEEG